VSMSALSFDDGEVLVDPDDLKMPERAVHRQTADLLGLAATHLLGAEVRVFRDLNWYPSDGGTAVAPDVMILPRTAVDPLPRSYRQDETGGPPPLAVIEIASDTDTFASLRAKARRYQRLGTTVYVVVVDDEPCVLRLGPDDDEFVDWTGRPLPELGGPSMDVVDDGPRLTMPDGVQAASDAELMAAVEERAAQRAEEAERRAEELAIRLRALGEEPDQPVT
jgi:Uma2 family endonuclease